MARQAKQVHIYLYRKKSEIFEYAIFRRSDMPICWQGVCGGLEDEETLEEGVRRELFEEAGITDFFEMFLLETVSYVPANQFSPKHRDVWGEKIVVIPMYCYAIKYDGEIILSDEHTEMRWMKYDEAMNVVYFDSQKTALYELNEKLLRGIIK